VEVHTPEGIELRKMVRFYRKHPRAVTSSPMAGQSNDCATRISGDAAPRSL